MRVNSYLIYIILLFFILAGSVSAAFQQSTDSGNLLVMEVENFNANVPQGAHTWNTFNAGAASGGSSMRARPNNGTINSTNYATNSPRLDFNVEFVTTGTHYVWIRGFGKNNGEDSVHVGLDNIDLTSSRRIDDFTFNTWDWSGDISVSGSLQRATINVTTTGSHTINIWMREDNFRADKILLTTDVNFVPTGTGPAESSQSGGGNNPPSITNPGNQTNTEGDPVSLQIQASDPDVGDTLSYSASGLPAGLSINTTSGLISGTTNTAGSSNVTVTVNDGNGGTANTNIIWNVNTSGGGGSGFQQSTGSGNLLVMEVENFDNNVQQGNDNWTVFNNNGASGGSSMRPLPDNGDLIATGYVTTSPRLDYEVTFVTTGTHYVWVRGFGRNTGADSVHIGLDNVDLTSSRRFDDFTIQTWDWSGDISVSGSLQRATINVTTAGSHTINMWMREDGFRADKILLTTDVNFVPTGDGPAESPQGGGGNNPPSITNPGNQTNTEGDSVSLQIQASDPDAGDTLSYSASGLPTGLSINTTSGLITGTTNIVEATNVTVTVNDGNGGTANTNFTWTINTSGSGGNGFQQSSGSGNLLVMEVENFDNNIQQGNDSWTVFNNSGASGGSSMRPIPDNGDINATNYATQSPRLDFNVNFVTTGTHYVWIRGFGPNLSGDSVHAGLDGVDLPTVQRFDDFVTSTWDWSGDIQVSPGNLQRATINVTSTGNHTINIWMREDGFRADKILLTTDVNFVPSGDGPAESPNGGGSLSLPFTDNFNDGNANGWTEIDEAGNASNWTVASNQYRQLNEIRTTSSLDESYHLGSFSFLDAGITLQDYQVSVNVIPRGASGDSVGIMFRYTDVDNYYRVTFDSRFGYTRLEKRVNGQFTPLASNSIGYAFNQNVLFNIAAVGSNIIVELDGDPLFAVNDSSHSSGTVALHSAAESRFDNVSIENVTTPRIALATPVSHSVNTSNDISASAIAINAPAGATVRFILDGSNSKTDSTAPYSRNFNNIVQGNHTVEAELINPNDSSVIASDLNVVIGSEGDNYITLGDSITNGSRDRYRSDNTSADGRNFGFQGWQPNLNDALTQTLGYSHLVVNEGVGGDDSGDTLNIRLDSILARNGASNNALMFLGTNDAARSLPIDSGLNCGSNCAGTYSGNLQAIIDDINPGKTVYIARPPPSFGTSSTSTPFSDPLNTMRNGLIQDYIQVIETQLTGFNLGPNLFDCFLGNTNRFSLFEDNFHPNGLGYVVISSLWHDILTGAALPNDPCVIPTSTFILENLSDSTVDPFNKQNLIEEGNEYYVDRTFTITDIPTGLGIEDGVWVMTANDDRNNTSNTYLSFDVDRNVTVFVAYDTRATTLPNWLSNNFTSVGSQIENSQATHDFDLYSNTYGSGTISLGGNMAAGSSGGIFNNYIVIVVEQ